MNQNALIHPSSFILHPSQPRGERAKMPLASSQRTRLIGAGLGAARSGSAGSGAGVLAAMAPAAAVSGPMAARRGGSGGGCKPCGWLQLPLQVGMGWTRPGSSRKGPALHGMAMQLLGQQSQGRGGHQQQLARPRLEKPARTATHNRVIGGFLGRKGSSHVVRVCRTPSRRRSGQLPFEGRGSPGTQSCTRKT